MELYVLTLINAKTILVMGTVLTYQAPTDVAVITDLLSTGTCVMILMNVMTARTTVLSMPLVRISLGHTDVFVIQTLPKMSGFVLTFR